MTTNEQQLFWKEQYAKDYISKNDNYDLEGGLKCWATMLNSVGKINSLLECGSNVGKNIRVLNNLLPETSKSIIEISPDAYKIVTDRYSFDKTFNGSILDSAYEEKAFDLVFTMGVLIHIHPRDLLSNMKKMFQYSSRYILIGEYFNRTPVMIEYHGEKDKLFKSDFGKLFMENFPVRLVDYGFLWGHLYDNAGFDDITYWLFEKKHE
ncbi:MAG TPA: pseudaminic acid biosynthesis-associated methylase [Ferruginibacter sp.]|nr:pseudaminic acid biosynthesis-associated methylase [Ferruginibacter sp.]